MDLQENLLTDIEEPQAEIPHTQRVLANIIDLILELGSLVLFYTALPTDMLHFLINSTPVTIYLVVFVWITFYRLISIFALQRTIGMIICRAKYLNEALQPLTPGQKIIVVFLNRTKKIRIYKAS